MANIYMATEVKRKYYPHRIGTCFFSSVLRLQEQDLSNRVGDSFFAFYSECQMNNTR